MELRNRHFKFWNYGGPQSPLEKIMMNAEGEEVSHGAHGEHGEKKEGKKLREFCGTTCLFGLPGKKCPDSVTMPRAYPLSIMSILSILSIFIAYSGL